MRSNFFKKVATLVVAALSAVLLGIPVFAVTNPATGDGTKLILPIMGGLLAVSVILIIVYLVLSAKNKKKNR